MLFKAARVNVDLTEVYPGNYFFVFSSSEDSTTEISFESSSSLGWSIFETEIYLTFSLAGLGAIPI
jgi:hypothetical protein